MLKLGVIGLGPVWESYRAAMTQLRHPLQVTAVFDPRPLVAAQAAKDLRATACLGIKALADRPNVQAVLLMDPGWVGAAAIDLLSQCHKPVFIAPWLPCDLASAEHWYVATEQQGVTLMPAMWRRFLPVTIRLKELLATELGEPHEIRLPLELDPASRAVDTAEAVVGWFDFVWYLVRREPRFEFVSAHGDEWSILFPPRQPHPVEGASSSATRSCQWRIQWQPGQAPDALRQRLADGALPAAGVCNRLNFESAPLPRVHLVCERGTATMIDRTTLQWQRHDGEVSTEQLTSDRPERLIMLDHFSRRAVGGLIPVADFNDIARMLRLIQVAK